jgi:hypothetical protein
MHFVSASNGVRCHVGCEGEVAEPDGEKYASVTRHVLWKNRTKCGPTHFCQNSFIHITVEKVGRKMDRLCNFQKTAQSVYNRLRGENSPNLVTLLSFWRGVSLIGIQFCSYNKTTTNAPNITKKLA